MVKYTIEGNLNFNDMLNDMLNKEENEETNEEVCLITGEPLIKETAVTMICGHKFNHLPLFNDLKNNIKTRYGNSDNNKIRCPYCRRPQNTLIPYNPDIVGVEKIAGINTVEFKNVYVPPSIRYNYNLNSNDYKLNGYYMMGNYKFVTGDCFYKSIKNNHCGCILVTKIEDGKTYCYKHYESMIKRISLEKAKKIKLETQLKEKEEKALQKQKAKEDKEKAKEEKKKAKDAATTTMTTITTITIDSSNNETQGCLDVLKSGAKKGTTCGCKIFNENLCKRHYNLKNKTI